MSKETNAGYKSGNEMWADYKAHYGLIPAHIMCGGYLDMVSRFADPEARRFCGELSEAMAMEPNFKDRPYYAESFDYAQLNNEDDSFHDSDAANVKCADEIAEAVNACRYQDGSYKLDPAVRVILDRHNAERVGYVLATEVRRNRRAFSKGNREWALDFNIQSGFVHLWSGTRSNVFDDFVTGFREASDRNRGEELAAPGSDEPDSLNAKLRKAAEYIISTGAAETTSGNYSVHMGDVPADILPRELLMEHIKTIADLTQEYESVSDAYVMDSFIDVNFYLAYCPNYEPQAEERDEYPPAREILDPLTNKPLARETDAPADSAAFTVAIGTGGKDMFSADTPQPLAGVPGKTGSDEYKSVIGQIRAAEKMPKPPRREKAPGQRKRKNGEEL